MENTICKSLTSLAIRKFIIKSIDSTLKDIKLVYIGNQTKKTKEILKKIEINEFNNNYNSTEIKKAIDKKDITELLKSSEHKHLDTIIPNYIKKLGNMVDYNVFFIYTYIEDHLPIEHIRILLYETIKKDVLPMTQQDDNLYLPYNMLLYHYPKSINFDYFTEHINFIFGKDNKIINNDKTNKTNKTKTSNTNDNGNNNANDIDNANEDDNISDSIEDSFSFSFDNQNNSNINKVLSNEHFFNNLYKITFMNKYEIINKLKELLPNKYKKEEPSIITNEEFDYESCLQNEDLQYLLLNTPIILTTQYSTTFKTTQSSYFGYKNIDYIISNYKKYSSIKNKQPYPSDIKNLDKKQLDIFKDTIELLKFKLIDDSRDIIDTNFLYLNLNHYNKAINDDYFIILKNDIDTIDKEIKTISTLDKTFITIKNVLGNFYFPEEFEKKIKKTKQDYKFIADKLKLNDYTMDLFNNNSIIINDCYCEDMVFDTLSNKLNTSYNLDQLFNLYTTDYYNPIIKLYKNNIENNVKLYKSSIKSIPLDELKKILTNYKYKNKNDKMNKHSNYIEFIWRIPYINGTNQSTDKQFIIITILFYENGYIVADFNTLDSKITLNKDLTHYFKYLKKTIKNIKKIIKIKFLKNPSLLNLLTENSKLITYCKINV